MGIVIQFFPEASDLDIDRTIVAVIVDAARHLEKLFPLEHAVWRAHQRVKQLATEWGQHNINVNGIAPGFVPTPMMAQAQADAPFMQMMRGRIPLARFATPTEVAAVALFLAAPASGFVSGELICVDGGVMASS